MAPDRLPVRCLQDWGAEVIKVEPLEGEAGRYTSKVLGMRADELDNPHAELINANKKSLPLNLKHPEGKAVMDKLLASANVFVSNYRIRALDKLGIGWEEMHAKHPHIIWAVLTGFGLYGPAANNAGFDTVAFWARSGAMIDFSENGELPLTPPFALGDFTTACSLAAGIAAACYQQAKTRSGRASSDLPVWTGTVGEFRCVPGCESRQSLAQVPQTPRQPAAQYLPLQGRHLGHDGHGHL